MPRFISTNRDLPGGFKEAVSFREALAMGQAPDLGLFMPDAIPTLAPEAFVALKDRPFQEAGQLMLGEFLKDDLPRDAIAGLVRAAHDFPVPLERADERAWILRLDQGPTASFKDFAARVLARLMTRFRASDGPMTVLVATSGDTGSAVGEAFRGLPGVRVFILYPEREVSAVQKRQLDGIGGNVRALSVAGTFDDCQALAKGAFADPALAHLGLTSANSINFGRTLPQSFYYAWAWAQVAEPGEPVVFSVPSGNFGNAFGCELARRMGLPVAKLVMATNGNDEFPRFLDGAPYAPVRPSRNCLSNAMNVGHPSNLARFFDLFGGAVDKDGRVRKAPDREAMRSVIFSTSVSDEATVAAMRRAWERKILLEPHGAVGWEGLERYRASTGDASKAIVLETAHPAKFPEAVRDALGIEPEPPEALRAAMTRPGSATPIEARAPALKDVLLA